MRESLYFYKLVSPYSEDVTKNCKLTINEIDSNFLTLKDADIKEAYFDKEKELLVLVRNNGEEIFADLSDATYDFDVSAASGNSGITLNITYTTGGEEHTFSLENIITYENLDKLADRRTITDDTLTGDGTMDHPLGVNKAERTGMYAPVECLIDIIGGYKLPDEPARGDRFITREYVNDYGYLYNGAGLEHIERNISLSKSGWRVPTKEDWDKLLNSMEPCEYQDHNDERCHRWLGKYAGKYLKSTCGWIGQPECLCGADRPIDPNCSCIPNGEGFPQGGCTTDDGGHRTGDCPVEDEPTPAPDVTPEGIDKYGMTIRPAGLSEDNRFGGTTAQYYQEKAFFWTSTHVCDDPGQDRYIKAFTFDRAGVLQEADCPEMYYSVRLVKDYDGSNYFGPETIDGISYDTVLFPETSQVWMAVNYAKTDGFNIDCKEYAHVNDGDVHEDRIAYFVNEYDGRRWLKKQLSEGDTVVITNPPVTSGEPSSITVCWKDEEGVEECIEVENVDDLNNSEYRVLVDDNCDAYIDNTDNLVFINVIKAVAKLIVEEKREREEADEILDDKIEAEIGRATSAETELWESIAEETERAISAETALDEKIEAEIERATSAETALDEKIDAEIERAIERENEIEGMTLDTEAEYIISVESGLTLTFKNGDTLQVGLDGDWGTF